MSSEAPRIGVGLVVWKGEEVLLIKRGKPPFLGEWSIPGGGLEFGETLHAAALRELDEETGVEADIVGLIDVVEVVGAPDAGHMVLIDYAARWRAGDPRPGDDAAEAAWFTEKDALERLTWGQTRRIIRESRRLMEQGSAI